MLMTTFFETIFFRQKMTQNKNWEQDILTVVHYLAN